MNEILSHNELQSLTGYKSNKRIIKWLNSNRIPFLCSGEGRPLVHRQALAYLMGAPVNEPAKEMPIELDFEHKGFK
jgi:hypothetical protein